MKGVMAEDLIKGHVKWFNDAKGFGFIQHPNGQDVFVHYSVIDSDGFKTLKDGEPVVYSISEGNKGMHATLVRKLTVEAPAEGQATGGTARSQIEVEVTPSTSQNTTTQSESVSIDGMTIPAGIIMNAAEEKLR